MGRPSILHATNPTPSAHILGTLDSSRRKSSDNESCTVYRRPRSRAQPSSRRQRYCLLEKTESSIGEKPHSVDQTGFFKDPVDMNTSFSMAKGQLFTRLRLPILALVRL